MSRSRRFEERVKIERTALEIVNTSFLSQGAPLAGLTAAAIDSWIKRVSGQCDEVTLNGLHEILVSIASETGASADNSRAVFASTTELHKRAVRSLLTELKARCRPLRHPI